MLVDLLQSNPPPHLLKLGLSQRLGEYVYKLISSRDVAGLDTSIFQAVSDEVVLDSYVLAPVMEDWVLGRAKADLLSTFNSTTSTSLPSSSPSSLDNHSA